MFSPAVVSSISRVSDTDWRVLGVNAFGADDGNGFASLAVRTCLHDVLGIGGPYSDRPSVAPEPEELAAPPRGSSWDLVDAAGVPPYTSAVSGSDGAGAATPSARLPGTPIAPIIPGLDPAEVAQTVQSGVSREELEALGNAFPPRPANTRPTMREHVEYRSRFSSSHRPSMLAAWSVAGLCDPLRDGRPAEALGLLDVLTAAFGQLSFDGGSLLRARELLWEREPPTIAYSASSVETARMRPCSPLCVPEWAKAAFSRRRDLDDWVLRKRRLTNMGPTEMGRRRGKPTDTGDHGGAAGHDGPSAGLAPRRRAKTKAKGKPPGGG